MRGVMHEITFFKDGFHRNGVQENKVSPDADVRGRCVYYVWVSLQGECRAKGEEEALNMS